MSHWKRGLTAAAVLLLVVVAMAQESKPKANSPVISARTPGHAMEVEADVTGAKELYLIVADGGDGFSCDWADWAEPRLVGLSGETKLTELKWKAAEAQWGSVGVNKNANGGPLKIAGQPVAYGIGTHANSVIAYDLPADHKFTKFKARAGLDNGGTDQGGGSTVKFMVFTSKPDAKTLAALTGGAVAAGHDPADAVAGLDVAEGLAAQLFASEPMMTNPSNIDIDHRGRIWVCDVKNYRGHRGERPEGDRILILEDTNGDAKADKVTTFYQGTDIDSPHGVTVLGTPDGKNTRVIVSAGDKVQVFVDKDGDDKADEKSTLFSGISGAQHDHGIHQFIFGPDGKLYFNFGNAGEQLKDKDGKPVVDKAGNIVAALGKPYRQGMVFRCNLDGSEVETLGWNFRNNWMVTVDSFGTLWQSDNDDDGNKGVRINYVMEFGNYGYTDEITGAGWQSPRTNLEKEIPQRHWHLNDPGVVPNLLLTGAGSPTGICVYEGDLLPAVFRNQIIHCDAGPNVVRAYPVKNSGAGYTAETVNILHGARDSWFRPSDVKVAPDGSLIVADWYDPGVGGHAQGDVDRGRLFRVAPSGNAAYKVPKFDFTTPEGAVEALKSPTPSVRAVAWQALHGMGEKAMPALVKLSESDNPRYRARAFWLIRKRSHFVPAGFDDKDENVRASYVRACRQIPYEKEETRQGMIAVFVMHMADDPSAMVRREVAISLRGMPPKLFPDEKENPPAVWVELALQYDGHDRWYLEALGIGADKQWDAFLDEWLAKVGDKWNTPAGRDIIWRSRAKKTPELLVKILKDPATPKDQHPKFMRAFDFQSDPEKKKALESLVDL